MTQIVLIAMICALIIVFLRGIQSEYYSLALVCGGIILIDFSINYVAENIEFINKIFEMTGLDEELLSIIYKIISIGYIVEFGAGTIEDFGLKGLADKLVFVGKLIILSVSLPILYSLINLITTLVQ